MTSTALTTTTRAKGSSVTKIDMSKFDPRKMMERANRFSNAVGSGDLGGPQRFPGQKFSYSSGIWYRGIGKKKSALPLNTEFVVNVFQMAATWVRWEDKKPKYLPDMYHLADGDEMPARDTLGDMDQDYWEKDDKGTPQDPWRPVLVIPIRDEDGDVVNHIEFTTKSSVRVGFDLFREVAESLVSHLGELPVVKLGSKKAEMEREVTKSKRDRKTGNDVEYSEKVIFKWDTPVMEVVSWTDMKECDDPDAEQSAASDDVGDVEARERTPAAKKVTAAKPEPKQAAPKGKRKVQVVDADEDEDDI